VIPSDSWRKTFSLCDPDGDRLLLLETSSENTVLVAGSINGIAFELFRSQGVISVSTDADDTTKFFIIRSHSLFVTTAHVLDIIHSCLLNDESPLYWPSASTAAQRYTAMFADISIAATFILWLEIQPRDFKETMRRQQTYDIINWCIENADDDMRNICDSVLEKLTMPTTPQSPWAPRVTGQGHHSDLFSIKPWDLAQYLAVYDYVYISRILLDSSLEELLSQEVPNNKSISYPDLRADQVICLRIYSSQVQYWVTISILNSPSASLRIKSICLFIETAMVCRPRK
jgi:hypothetical protein